MSFAESDDSYPHIVAVLNPGWRVIVCRDGIQWILQRRNLAETVARHVWRGRSCASLPDGTVLVASSRRPFLDADAVDDQVERPNVHRRKARSDGLFAVGWADDADGPFESRGFAQVGQVGTAEESPDECLRRAE